MDKIHISYSQLTDYLSCNYKHYLGYAKKLKSNDPDNIHLIFGLAIHSSIELYLKKEVNTLGAYTHFVSAMINADTIKKYNNADLIKFKEQGLRILNELFTRFDWNEITVIGNEIDLYEPIFANFFFKAKIDFVYKHKNYIYITDWKTSTEPWNNYKFNDKHYGLQLKLYKYFFAVKNKIPFDQIKTLYFVLNRNESKSSVSNYVTMHEVKSDYKTLLESYQLLTDALKVMYYPEQMGEYLRQTIGWNCNICDFNGTEHCGGNKETKFYRDIKKNRKSKEEERTAVANEVAKILQNIVEKYNG